MRTQASKTETLGYPRGTQPYLPLSPTSSVFVLRNDPDIMRTLLRLRVGIGVSVEGTNRFGDTGYRSTNVFLSRTRT